jgi:hypothetical protein
VYFELYILFFIYSFLGLTLVVSDESADEMHEDESFYEMEVHFTLRPADERED